MIDSEGKVQVIANSFYLHRILTTTEYFKIIIVSPWAAFNGTAEQFIDTLNQFSSSFTEITHLSSSIALVVT